MSCCPAGPAVPALLVPASPSTRCQASITPVFSDFHIAVIESDLQREATMEPDEMRDDLPRRLKVTLYVLVAIIAILYIHTFIVPHL